MHKLLAVFLTLIALTSAAYDHAYEVSGRDEFGRPISGLAFSNDNQLAVSGEITDAYGDKVPFQGQWINRKEIHGQTNDQVKLNLVVD